MPIGGFPSAQEMILWAISKERVLYTQKGFNSIMKRACATLKNSMLLSFKPGPTLTFPSAKVLPRNIEFFETFGMKGWFQQSNKTLGWVTLNDTRIQFQALGTWDSHPQGPFGHIVLSAPRRERAFLSGYLTLLNPRSVMLADTRHLTGCLTPDQCPNPPSLPSEPVVLFGRYVDNVYTGVVGIQDNSQLFHSLTRFLEVFLNAVYGIPMKWKPVSSVNDWCEARLITEPEFAILWKGVSYQHPATDSPLRDFKLWNRWVDCFSPNAQRILKSMMPSIVNKGILLPKLPLHRQMNVASLIPRVCAAAPLVPSP